MAAIILLIASVASASVQGLDVRALASRLAAADIATRANAVLELDKAAQNDFGILANVVLQRPIVVLLETENALVAKSHNSFLVTKRDDLGEDYSEHYSRALGIANRLRKGVVLEPLLSSRLRRALVLGVYNPESEFAKDIALEGDAIVPLVLELSKSASGPQKWNAFGLTSALFEYQEARSLSDPLSAASVVALRAAARAGLSDPAPDVRREAIPAVVSAKDYQAIPMLQHLAQNDPDVSTGPSNYSVRALAAAALKELQR